MPSKDNDALRDGACFRELADGSVYVMDSVTGVDATSQTKEQALEALREAVAQHVKRAGGVHSEQAKRLYNGCLKLDEEDNNE